jgi:hypothetical protein
LILTIYVIILIIGIWILYGWVWEAHDNSRSSISEEDQDYWYDEYERRIESKYLEIWIISTTAIAALIMIFHDRIRNVQPEG